MSTLPPPESGRAAAESFVARNLGHLVADAVTGSSTIGGQPAAAAALEAFDVTGYAKTRNDVWPPERRGASRLSPYIRHGLLQLPEVWRAVAEGPAVDVKAFRNELLWQEYSRHWYGRLGRRTQQGIRREIVSPDATEGWNRDMACIDLAVSELEREGWLVNQTRMWLASHWSVRHGRSWRDGEDEFFGHLIDGSRAANRLGWQWTTGVGSSKSYGFSRLQVDKRAPALCSSCALEAMCPIEEWPDEPRFVDAPGIEVARRDLGPDTIERTASADTVWITAESLGTADPAMTANPTLPVVFVFDEPLLAKLQLSSKRLIFLTETLAELATVRDLEVVLGDPVAELDGRLLAVTHAPVPGFDRRSAALATVERHPWPWLTPPGSGSISSFSAWRKSATVVV